MTPELSSLFDQYLREQLQEKLLRFSKASSSLLVVGSQGLPTAQVVKYLVQSRLCLHKIDSKPCGKCNDCLSVLEKQNIYCKWVEPEGQFIKVEQVRSVIEFLSYKKDRDNVVVLHQADRLNTQAANALLKTLEEPPEKTWIILTASSAKALLPTVRSRVLVLNIPPISPQLITQFKGSDFLNAGLIQGRFDRLEQDQSFFDSLGNLELWIREIKEHKEPELIEWMDSKEGFVEGLEKLRLLLRQKVIINKSQLNDLYVNKWIELVSRIDELEQACLQNVDRKLLTDHLYMAIEELYVLD